MRATPCFIAITAICAACGGAGDGGADAAATIDAGGADVAADAGTAPDAGLTPDTGADAGGPTACNGAAALCARRFDEVSYPTTHNAMSSEEEGWISPNQRHAVPRQLADGVRALMLDTHYDGGVAYLCHGTCAAGKKLLSKGLVEIRRFLDENPGEIVTIIFESYVSAEDTAAAFAKAGLDAYAHAQEPGAPWPTLQEMIAEGRRLVVFTDSGGGTYPWYMDVWAHAWETHYAAKTPADLSCAMNRGSAGNALFIFNHFLTDPLASPDLAAQVNFDPLLVDRARACMAASGRLPNFVTVDFYDIGDIFSVIRALNGGL